MAEARQSHISANYTTCLNESHRRRTIVGQHCSEAKTSPLKFGLAKSGNLRHQPYFVERKVHRHAQDIRANSSNGSNLRGMIINHHPYLPTAVTIPIRTFQTHVRPN